MLRSELSPDQRQESLASPEVEKRHHLFIGVQGTVASGKTALAIFIAGEFGMVRVKERHLENPFLEDFYNNPKKYSYLSQMFFLEAKVEDEAGMPKDRAVVLAPDHFQDYGYAHVQRLMGWMTNREYQNYLRNSDRLLEISEVPNPDIIISVRAPIKVILKRIRRRAEENRKERERELWMLENHPKYFDLLARRLEEWARENPYNIPVIRVDSGKYDYVNKPVDASRVASQIQGEVFEHLGDRKDIILPPALSQLTESDLLEGVG